MEFTQFFKSVLDEDHSAIVICDLNHIIIYMNSAAFNKYKKRGGKLLLGKSLLGFNQISLIIVYTCIMMIKKIKMYI